MLLSSGRTATAPSQHSSVQVLFLFRVCGKINSVCFERLRHMIEKKKVSDVYLWGRCALRLPEVSCSRGATPLYSVSCGFVGVLQSAEGSRECCAIDALLLTFSSL